MGFVQVVPADGLVTMTLACGDCGRARTWPVPFYSDRIAALDEARRLGWGWRQDNARRCPVCQAMATRFGLWGIRAHELLPDHLHKNSALAPAVAPGTPLPTHTAAVAPAAPVQLSLFAFAGGGRAC